MVGLEPTSLSAADFKSAVFTISPHNLLKIIYSEQLKFEEGYHSRR